MGSTSGTQRPDRVRRRTQHGAAAVEFALVVPLLIMLAFGIIAFGIVFAQKLALGNGAREAARSGVVDGSTCAQVIASAKDASNTISMSGSQVTVTVKRGQTAQTASQICAGATATEPCAGSLTGDSVYVEVDFVSKLIIPFVIVKDEYPISGQGVFRCEFA